MKTLTIDEVSTLRGLYKDIGYHNIEDCYNDLDKLQEIERLKKQPLNRFDGMVERLFKGERIILGVA